jgi:hypothetical protein
MRDWLDSFWDEAIAKIKAYPERDANGDDE